MRIAVCIPYHDDREYLTKCLESLHCQSTPVDEILIYDDCSVFPAADYVPQEIKCKILRGDRNLGPCVGRNILVRESACEYVHCHDADDLFAPNWCSKIRLALDATGVDVIFTQLAPWRDGRVLTGGVIPSDWPVKYPNIRVACLRQILLPDCATIRRRLFLECGGYREDQWMAEDYEFYARLALLIKQYRVLREPLGYVRSHAEQRSREPGQYTRWLARAVLRLHDVIPPELRPELAEMAAFVGVSLLKAGLRQEGLEALAFAEKIGPPRYDMLRPVNRMLCRWIGPSQSENFTALYRGTVPERVRAWLAVAGL